MKKLTHFLGISTFKKKKLEAIIVDTLKPRCFMKTLKWKTSVLNILKFSYKDGLLITNRQHLRCAIQCGARVCFRAYVSTCGLTSEEVFANGLLDNCLRFN